MRHRVVTWEPGMPSLGKAVVAIGVFDGVHLGHQALLRDAVGEAKAFRARSVALTFDRDPDQVVCPDVAAPQLLTLQDKCDFILETGIETVLVVPFTAELAAMAPEAFLDRVLADCCDVRAIHVGRDFRFGANASGHLDTLLAWAAEHAADVRPHALVTHEGATVTSTRIRRLVAAGDVEGAAELLGRPTRVTGAVHEGRQQGRELGFPTANVVPAEYAALPADGVYAGTATLEGGGVWPAAIAVGTPPSFPEARDYLEAHLIGFDGDLYDTELVLEFTRRIREQRAFGSLDELTSAIAADVAAVVAPPEDLEYGVLESGEPVVEDEAALDAAERAVRGLPLRQAHLESDEPFVPVTNPRHLSGLFGEAGFSAALVTGPLRAANIPFAWEPYDPEQMPTFRPAYGVFDRKFTLLVPESRLAEAREVLGVRE